MGETTACVWCETDHDRDLLCDPARRTLDALHTRGARGNTPAVELPAPIPHEQLISALGGGPGDRVVQTFEVLAGTAPVAGVPHPVLIFTGVDTDGVRLPRWIRPGTVGDHARTVKLMTDMVELAVRTAREQRAQQ